MKMDLSIYEMSLRQTERDLGSLDDERTRLRREIASMQGELRGLATKRIEWLQLSGGLKKLLGVPLTEEETKVAGDISVASERLVTIPKNAFQGMGPAEAARKYLLMLGRPATHREVVEGLRKGKVNSEARHLDASLRTAMQRRTDWFVWTKEKGTFGMWELTEWQNEENYELDSDRSVPEKTPRRLSAVSRSDSPAPAQQAP
jgi:hypothetical protein